MPYVIDPALQRPSIDDLQPMQQPARVAGDKAIGRDGGGERIGPGGAGRVDDGASFGEARVAEGLSTRALAAARAAYRCSRNGSTSEPRSATRNGVLCAMSPLMK